MRRLLLVPVVIVPVAAAAWYSGLVHPIIMTAWSVVAPRPETKHTEDDMVG